MKHFSLSYTFTTMTLQQQSSGLGWTSFLLDQRKIIKIFRYFSDEKAILIIKNSATAKSLFYQDFLIVFNGMILQWSKFKVVPFSSKKKLVLFASMKPIKNDEKWFWFHVKSFFHSWDIQVFVWFFLVMQKNDLIRKLKVISKFMT